MITLAGLVLVLTLPVAERQQAPSDGWGAQEGGTRGGALAVPAHVYTVRDRAQLIAALAAPAPARIVRVDGRIDMSGGQPYRSTADQARRGSVRIPSHTTIIGTSQDAGFINGSLLVQGVEQVIIRNLALRNPCDVSPEWDPHDGPKGNWNSQFDGITVNGSHHVWIDHNSFTDAPQTDDLSPIENGMRKQCHDGALDITHGSDFVSVTANRFAMHEKNSLVGSSDRAVDDQGHLRVTFKGNLFEHVAERAPRVRFGRVHVFNNYYIGDRARSTYAHHYSIGPATQASIISDANAFDIAGAGHCAQVVRNPGPVPGVFTDHGSLLNGQPLRDCPYAGDASWQVPYAYAPLPAAQVAQQVLSDAGPILLAPSTPVPPTISRASAEANGGGGETMFGGGRAIEVRMVPAPGSPFVLHVTPLADVSVRLLKASRELEVELLETRAGTRTPVRLKQVRRPAPPDGVPITVRAAIDNGQLIAWLDADRVSSAALSTPPGTSPGTPLSASLGAAPGALPGAAPRLDATVGGPARPQPSWHAGTARVLDARVTDAPPITLQLRIPDRRLHLQAGDPSEVIAEATEPWTATSSQTTIATAEWTPGGLAISAHAPGTARITLARAADPWQQAAFDVIVGPQFVAPPASPAASKHPMASNAAAAMPSPDRAPSMTPRPNETGVPPDAPLAITFTEPPQLTGSGSIRIIRRRDQHLAAIIRPGPQVRAIGTAARHRWVHAPAITVEGTTLQAALPVELERGTEYEVLLEASLLTRGTGHRWSFTTTSYAPVGDSITVSRTARADFRTIQGALNYAMSQPRGRALTINIHDGIYPELLYLAGKDKVTLRGQSREATIIRAANSDARNPGAARALFLAEDDDLLELRDLTLHNTIRRADGPSAQAETLFFDNDYGRLLVRNARFTSEQDTLRLTGYAWFYRSLVEGNVDFIWGNNRAALFEESEIRSIGDSARPDSGGYIVQARTVAATDPGFVFANSRFTAGPGPAGNVPPPASTWLARSPGTPTTWDHVSYIDCTFGPHIAGWLHQPAPHPADGWREAGNRAFDGKPRTFDGAPADRASATRSTVFAHFDAGRGWAPQP